MQGGSDEERERVRVRSRVDSGQAMQSQGQIHLCSGDRTHLCVCVCACGCVYTCKCGWYVCVKAVNSLDGKHKQCIHKLVTPYYYCNSAGSYVQRHTYLNDIHEPSPGQGVNSC